MADLAVVGVIFLTFALFLAQTFALTSSIFVIWALLRFCKRLFVPLFSFLIVITAGKVSIMIFLGTIAHTICDEHDVLYPKVASLVGIDKLYESVTDGQFLGTMYRAYGSEIADITSMFSGLETRDFVSHKYNYSTILAEFLDTVAYQYTQGTLRDASESQPNADPTSSSSTWYEYFNIGGIYRSVFEFGGTEEDCPSKGIMIDAFSNDTNITGGLFTNQSCLVSKHLDDISSSDSKSSRSQWICRYMYLTEYRGSSTTWYVVSIYCNELCKLFQAMNPFVI